MNILSTSIPSPVSQITKVLRNAGYESYLVGGCVRDLFLGRTPKDWDVATNATPEQIIALFPETFYENTFGTVGVVTDSEDPTLKVIEITPYRLESEYSDKRRPDSVEWSQTLDHDLKRRDFTINAIAITEKDGEIEVVDLFDGKKDLKDKVIRTVGDPHLRFSEDALRIMRAIRLSMDLGFHVEQKTEEAIKTHAKLLDHISQERIRDEFTKVILSPRPEEGISFMRNTGILPFVIPELEEGFGIEQNQAHSYDVWTHILKTVQHSADKKFPIEIRLSALLHDIGKPRTRRFSRETNQYTFYGHEVVGAKMAQDILERLKFPRKTIEIVTKLVRWHMFFSDPEAITLSAVRRMIVNVGKEHIWDLMHVRECDRIGTGRPKENPYRLRKYKAMIEEALRDPISVGMLKIDGKEIMETLATPPGPKVGLILNALMEEVLDDPSKNTKEFLVKRTIELSKEDEATLKKQAVIGKEKKDQAEEAELKKIRSKHKVK